MCHVLRGEGLHRASVVVITSSCIKQWGELMGPQKGKDFLCKELNWVPFPHCAWGLPCLKSALP